ncbi:hypothetical protein E1161_06460 [Saccharopolyspora aridisoli]|uniref:Uncharacterized protein n=1 Tax=Saccharopolyspora aridisoli TaxID=2530385 RepID=A0A4R4URM4_9PSEU|nr:hypothetical protein E1161_06460 [Saccharopolyspora aridisoli]
MHALATACGTFATRWECVVEHESSLLSRVLPGSAEIPGLRELSSFGTGHDRVGVVSFTIDGQDPGLTGAVLSAEHAIGVRDGLFCAHLATKDLLARAGGGRGRGAARQHRPGHHGRARRPPGRGLEVPGRRRYRGELSEGGRSLGARLRPAPAAAVSCLERGPEAGAAVLVRRRSRGSGTMAA